MLLKMFIQSWIGQFKNEIAPKLLKSLESL